MPLNERRDWLSKEILAIAGIMAFALFLRFIFFHGFFPSDQFSYSQEAFKIAQGDWEVPSNTSLTRWAFILPTALFYKLLGVNEFSSTLWSMLCSLGTVFTAYLLGKHLRDHKTGVNAGLILAIFPLEIIYSGQLMADGPLSFWLLLSLYFFLKGDKKRLERSDYKYFVLSGIAFALAYATKLEAFIVLPFFAIYGLIARRLLLKQAAWFILGFLSIFVVEYLFFSLTSGDGFLRFSLMLNAKDARATDFVTGVLQQDTSFLRYFYWLFVDIHYVGLSFVIAILLTAIHIADAMRGKKRRIYSYWPLLTWTSVIFLALNFFPLQTNPYVPLYKQINYMLMFTAPLLVVLALLLNEVPLHLQRISLGLILLSCLPSAYLSRESHRAHVENSRVIHEFYSRNKDRPMLASNYNIAALEYFNGFKNIEHFVDFTLRTRWGYQANAYGEMRFGSSYIAVDQYFLEFYGRLGHEYPTQVIEPPPNWKAVFKYQRKPRFVQNLGLKIADLLGQVGVLNDALHLRISNKIQRWSHSKPVIIYSR